MAAQAEPGRVQKVMAAAGLGSRRALEIQISEGKVLINGKPAQLGQLLKPTDTLNFRDREYKVVAENAQHRTLIYNKPEGQLTTRSDPEDRPTVFDQLPDVKGARWVAVGRLDINTTGLLLLTTDGELANAMMHPSNQVDREYVCRIRGMVSDEQLERLRNGVMLEDGPARFSDVQRMTSAGGNQWFQVTILEGRNREVRRLWEILGFMVSRLKRVRYGGAKLPKGLKVGRWVEGSPRDHRVLREDVGLAARPGQLSLQPVQVRGKPRPAGKPGKFSKGRTNEGAGRLASRPSKPWSDRAQPERRHADAAHPERRHSDPAHPERRHRDPAHPERRQRDPAHPGWQGTGRSRSRGSVEQGSTRPNERASARPHGRPTERTNARPGARPNDRPDARANDRPNERRVGRTSDRPVARPGSPAGAGRRQQGGKSGRR